MSAFSWVKNGVGVWVLTNGTFPLATITPGAQGYLAEYCWRDPSGGNDPTSWAVRATVAGCKTWVVRELAKFWNAPKIAA